MRTVSHDDYLLARGANPRTGVVTPSVHSGSNSLEDPEWLRMGAMSAPAKWRMKGDQWVSLGLDEPSPLPSPPANPRGTQRGRGLRVPPRLTGPRQVQPQRFRNHTQQSSEKFATNHADDNALVSRRAQTKEEVVAPAARIAVNRGRYEDNTMVRRKPLPAHPPVNDPVNRIFPSNLRPEASTETVIIAKPPREQPQSHPGPRLEKAYPKLNDGGKALPALPKSEPSESRIPNPVTRQGEGPFLGLRPGDWIEDIPNRINGMLDGYAKEPPCLLMKDIQSRSMMPEHLNSHSMPAMTGPRPSHKATYPPPRDRRKFIGAGGSYSAPRLRPGIRSTQPRHPMRMEAVQRPGQDLATEMASLMPLTRCEMSFQPRKTSVPTGLKSKGEEVEAHTERKTSISTPTITPITTPLATARTLPEDRLVSSSWRAMPSPSPSIKDQPSKAARPVMPGRMEGTTSVPQVSPPRGKDQHLQWRTTGISDSEISAISTSVTASPEGTQASLPLVPTNGNVAKVGVPREATVQEGEASTLTCPHCCESYVDAKQHSMHGSTRMQDEVFGENVGSYVDLSSTSGFLRGQAPSDHSPCCPDCCAIGCHGSCLGHRSPPTTPTAKMSYGLGTMKQVFRNSMRLSRRTRTRTSAGGSQETESEETAELETPLAWEDSIPINLGLPVYDYQAPAYHRNAASQQQPGKRVISNGSMASIKTNDDPFIGGFGGFLEALLVPLAALRMCLRNHPQLLGLISLVLAKLFEMSRHVLNTITKAYGVAYIYSKTGKINVGRSSNMGAFATDCTLALVYSLILGAIGVLVGRILAVIAGAGSWLVWWFGWVGWVLKGIGLGILW